MRQKEHQGYNYNRVKIWVCNDEFRYSDRRRYVPSSCRLSKALNTYYWLETNEMWKSYNGAPWITFFNGNEVVCLNVYKYILVTVYHRNCFNVALYYQIEGPVTVMVHSEDKYILKIGAAQQTSVIFSHVPWPPFAKETSSYLHKNHHYKPSGRLRFLMGILLPSNYILSNYILRLQVHFRSGCGLTLIPIFNFGRLFAVTDIFVRLICNLTSSMIDKPYL